MQAPNPRRLRRLGSSARRHRRQHHGRCGDRHGTSRNSTHCNSNVGSLGTGTGTGTSTGKVRVRVRVRVWSSPRVGGGC